jgi:poly-gamma-glutamate system protein
MIHAARLMEKAIAIVGSDYDKSGIEIDETIDPNHTGLVGPENSELTTTLGHLEAKRTTTNPDMAGLIVHLLHQAGVAAGDTIAVGSSASFPALMIATLAAAHAMEVYPVVILSLGASSYGGTNVDFNLLSIYQLLLREGVFTIQPAAVSLGGEKDSGQDFKPDIKERLLQQIQLSGIPFIYEPDLQKNVAARMKIYQSNSSSGRIAAFINIGGSYANLGTSELALELKSGLNKNVALPAKSERSVLFEMAAQDIPCIHLLFIKGLVMKYGLPWDPIPLPKPGASELSIN